MKLKTLRPIAAALIVASLAHAAVASGCPVSSSRIDEWSARRPNI